MLTILALKAVNFSAVAFNAKCDPTKDNPSSSFFGFPNWWKYIHNGTGDALGGCTPNVDFSNGPSEFLAIGLAAIDILLYIAGIAAVVSIVIAGVQYILAAGATDKITSSRKRIQNSLIGLAIVFIASGLVSFLGNALIK
jgi:hypothetical protein